MISFSRAPIRALTVGAIALLSVTACNSSTSGGSSNIDPNGALRFAIQDDVQTLDPGQDSSAVDITFVQNVFSGLVESDNTNKVIPGLASSWDLSSDGMTWTFHLNKKAKFSNGDPVTSKDVLYSWNRGAALSSNYGTIFDPVVGGPAVEAGKATTMPGLSAPDSATVVAKLSSPAPWFLEALALPTAGWVVDQKAVEATGQTKDTWWQSPQFLVGSGPFKMTARTPKASMDFEPVANWWGGSTGNLKKVHVDIGVDLPSQVQKFEVGGYDLVGMANDPPAQTDILRYKNDPTKSALVHIFPASRTTWLGFNYITGPFAGADGKAGRDAFSKAIDRAQLADVACAHTITCVPATGGFISKGLHGYLGDNTDPTAKFDAAAAKAEYKQWDPTGSKVAGLKITYNTSAVNDAVWGNVQSQLQANLGVTVQLDKIDFPTLISKREAKQLIMFRDSWGADYDNPQDWFDNLFSCEEAAIGKGNNAGYCNQSMDQIVKKADGEDLTQALPLYNQAQQTLINDVVGASLFYGTQPYITAKYVQGAGFTGLVDYSWTGISILKH